MKLTKLERIKYGFIIAFFSLNIINTYFLTSQILNRYISPLERSFIGEINAILGNLAVLLALFLVISVIFKKIKSRMIALTVVTLLLNFLIFALGFFNLFYGTAFAINALDIFKNPAEGISHGMFGVVMGELILYYRILVFLPFGVLLYLFISYQRINKTTNEETNENLSLKTSLSLIYSTLILMIISSLTFQTSFYNSKLPIGSTVSTYAIQNYGVYPFYVSNLFGIDFDVTSRKTLDLKDDDELFLAYDKYNKNKAAYTNIIDGKTYSNQLKYEPSDNLYVQNYNEGDLLNGIFKDKNLVLVHLESINQFLFEIEEIRSRMPFITSLLEESYVFNNYYTSVGMGVSADAELSILTGLYMNGYSTLYWDYNNKEFEFDTLPKLFNDQSYRSLALHGDHEDFYNRNYAYKGLMGFNEPYQSLEKFASDANMSIDDYKQYAMETGFQGHKSPWVSDLELSEFVYEKGNSYRSNNQKHFIFNVHTMPHTPFQFNPYKDLARPEYDKWNNKLTTLTRNYIDYVDYLDEVVERMFIGPNGEDRFNDDTVYVFYGDHGSSLKNGDLSILYDKELNMMEEREILQQVAAFIYAPSSDKTNVNGYEINKGIIKGEQNLVRSHIDTYRTIVDLFGLTDENDFYFGVNGLSNEPSFVIDNRIQDLIVDDITNNSHYIVSMRNSKKIYPNNKSIDKELLANIIEFKKLSDLLVNDVSVYKLIKNKL